MCLQSLAFWDHPRLRGEHCISSISGESERGSSPLTRGALEHGEYEAHDPGIIPAYAGSTPISRMCRHCVGDHPRLRGEHRSCAKCESGSRGSSPLTRGALILIIHNNMNVGIIPAYAGSTGHARSARAAAGDHPRLRGEHSWTASAIAYRRGSSPLTRGAPCMLIGDRPEHGIIPAYAGSTVLHDEAPFTR